MTGDFVASTDYGSTLLSQLTDGLDELVLSASKRGWCYGPIVFFRGDGWQLPTPDRLHDLLLMSVLIRTFLGSVDAERHCDTRIGLSIGPHEGFVPGDAATYQGEAFTRSGHILDASMKEVSLRMAYWNSIIRPGRPRNQELYRYAASTTILLDHMIQGWTSAQCLAVHHSLLGQTQEEIGELWGESALSDRPVSKAAIGQHLKAANYATLERLFLTLPFEEKDLACD